MSRPATAAQSSNRTQSVESRANLRRSVSAILAGMCTWSCQRPAPRATWSARGRRRGCPRCAATSGRSPRGHGPRRQSPRPSPRRQPDREPRAGAAARGRPAHGAGRTLPRPGRHRAAAPGSSPAPGPGTRAAAATARRPIADRRGRPRSGRRQAGSARSGTTDSNSRNCASAAVTMLDVAGPAVASSSQAASPSSVAANPRRAQDLGPRPVRRRSVALPAGRRAGRAPSGPAWSISAPSTAVLPIPASPLTIRN